MKLSEQWLREWMNPPVSRNELIAQLTMLGLEIESVWPVSHDFSGVVVGEVLQVAQHPDADRLRVCTVTIGDEIPLTIVCGASNVQAGLRVPVATVGAVLADDFKIKKSKLRGVISEGMICSASELGLAETSEGILPLPLDAPLGGDLRDFMKLDDHILDIKLTPNRGDCLSVLGIAREIAIANQRIFEKPIAVSTPISTAQTFPVEVQAPQACPRYLGRIITDINPTATTPLWMQERLRRSGIRCISPVVDVTNYVLLEQGQPLHAFDFDCLQQAICVRLAVEGETLTLLNGQTVVLDPNTLIIADAVRPLAIAGIMGGLDSAVTANTRTIFLESAYFDPVSLAGRARYYGVQTDSAYRFERGVDSELQREAIERATHLLLDIVGGSAGEIIEKVAHDQLPAARQIRLRASRIETLLGITWTHDEVATHLKYLQLLAHFEKDTGTWRVDIPSYRFDLQLEIDLIEELARVYGYANLPSAHLPIHPYLQVSPERELSLTRIRHCLVDAGYQEAITYSFVDPASQSALDPNHAALALLNPIAPELSVMRTQLWSGLINALIYNQHRQQSRIRLFETGLCFIQTGDTLQQIPRIAGIVTGPVLPTQWGAPARPVDFFDVKRDVQALLALSKQTDAISYELGTHPALHPGQSSQLVREGIVLGHLGKLHPALEHQLGLNQAVYVFELDLALLCDGELPRYKPISKFPLIRRDLAVLVDQTVSTHDLQHTVREIVKDYLIDLNVFDVYQGKGMLPTQKSIAMGLTLQHPSRTFVDDEVVSLMARVVEALQQAYGITLRDY